MSGGSFDYLCHQDCELSSYTHQIVAMRDQLRKDGYEDAAKRTDYVLQHLEKAQRVASELKDVWQAMEWWKSCDWNEDELRAAAEKLCLLEKRTSTLSDQRSALQGLAYHIRGLLERFPYADT